MAEDVGGSGATPPPGWWQASDGRWYAPELHPDRAVAPPSPTPGPPDPGATWASPGTAASPGWGPPPGSPGADPTTGGLLVAPGPGGPTTGNRAVWLVLAAVVALPVLAVLGILAITFLGRESTSRFEAVGSAIVEEDDDGGTGSPLGGGIDASTTTTTEAVGSGGSSPSTEPPAPSTTAPTPPPTTAPVPPPPVPPAPPAPSGSTTEDQLTRLLLDDSAAEGVVLSEAEARCLAVAMIDLLGEAQVAEHLAAGTEPDFSELEEGDPAAAMAFLEQVMSCAPSLLGPDF